ncbi:MAG: phosphoglycerate mutase family protein [Patescibacteria group bacterium]|nr:phosphoglycerate mutase family protein [Patescibacteria group bacterium]
MKIYLLRHTTADDDRRDSYGGIADDPLVDEGRDYAVKIGKILASAGGGIKAIYTSPYRRAKETADLVGKALNVSVTDIYNLRERNSYGVLSGIEKETAKTMFPEISARVKRMKELGTKPSASVESLPGAEIYLDLLLRIRAAFDQIFRESKMAGYDKVAIVTHGGLAWGFFNDIT